MATVRGNVGGVMTRSQARLIEVRVPRDPAGVVIVVHGGGGRGGMMRVSPAQLSVVRMIPIARGIARAGAGRLAVFRLLNTCRGWDSTHTPVQDVRWAMDQVRDRLGEVPACLVGHSLGGRAALLAADHPAVAGVVALAAWVHPTDGGDLPGRSVLFVHGSRDRIARPGRAAAVAQRLAGSATTRFALIEGGKHAMLAHHREFSRLTTEFVTAVLLQQDPPPTSAARDGVRWLSL